MYALTGASPSPFLICGLSPARSLVFFTARFGALDFVLAGRVLVAAVARLAVERLVFAPVGRFAGLRLVLLAMAHAYPGDRSDGS
jgi:hypothetical protein